MDLENKVALVTGAGRGIGNAIALRLAKAGASLIVNDLNLEDAERTVNKIVQAGGKAIASIYDIADRNSVENMVNRAVDRFKKIDILVNNAGIGGAACLVKDTPETAWQRTLDVNLSGVFHCCQAVIPIFLAHGGGRIVNIASLAARRMSKLGGADYTAAKWGVMGFSRHLAFELAASGINVNVICPGATLTPLVRDATTPEFRQSIGKQVPLGRWISPEEIAESVMFLVSDASAMITGITIDVDGGQLLGIASDYQEDLRRRTENSKKMCGGAVHLR